MSDARLADAGTVPRRVARDVYCYFDNDAKVMAPRDAQTLTKMLRTAGAHVVTPDTARSGSEL